MKTSTTKLIATLAITAGLLTTNAAFAKDGPGKSGGSGNGSNHSSSDVKQQQAAAASAASASS